MARRNRFKLVSITFKQRPRSVQSCKFSRFSGRLRVLRFDLATKNHDLAPGGKSRV